MEILGNLWTLYSSGAGMVFAPYPLFLILAGTVLGIGFGAMPGLSSTMALAILTPLTFRLGAGDAMAFLIAVYIGAVFAGALSAILVNIPGTPSSIATSFDGYPMARRGEAGRAIGLATMSSFLGGFFGLIILMTLSPALAQAARSFGSWEYCLLALLALTLISYVSSSSVIRGLIGGVLGLLIATIGADVIMAYPRFTFGVGELGSGLNMIVLMIGFFGFAEIFSQIEERHRPHIHQRVTNLLGAVQDLKGQAVNILRSSSIGAGVGILPGAGGSIASIAAYGISRRFSKTPEKFGDGSVEGLAAAESSNNSSVGGALVPMMTMGIPGDPMTAVLIGALMVHGLSPGPGLYIENPELVSTIFLGYFVALICMLIVGLGAARLFARLIAFPRHLVLGVITIFCILGTYSIQNSVFDVGVAAVAGLIGFLLKKVGIHPAPIILGIVLGPMLENNFRRAILLGDGDLSPFLTRPLSLTMILIIAFVLFAGPIVRLINSLRVNSRA